MVENFPRPYPCGRKVPAEGAWDGRAPCEAIQRKGQCPFRRADGTPILGDPTFYRQEDLPLDCWIWGSFLPADELPHSPFLELIPFECLENAARLKDLAAVEPSSVRRDWYLYSARWYRLVASVGCRAGAW